MSSADLMDDNFPHGTKAGYDAGCHSAGLCAGKESGQTCKQAKTRYAMDRAYRKLVDSGVSVEEQALPESAGIPTPPAKAKPAPKPRPSAKLTARPVAEDLQQWPDDGEDEQLLEREAATGTLPAADYEIAPSAVVPAAVEPKPSAEVDRAAGKHGTTTGYAYGCRDHCPGGPDGVTCREANRDAQRAAVAAKRAAADEGRPGRESGGKTAGPTGRRHRGGTSSTTSNGDDTPALAVETEEMTVNAAPEKTPELEATLAELREKHPPLTDAPPAAAETWPAQQGRVDYDPTYGRIDKDIQEDVDALEPESLGQRVAIENTIQDRRNREKRATGEMVDTEEPTALAEDLSLVHLAVHPVLGRNFIACRVDEHTHESAFDGNLVTCPECKELRAVFAPDPVTPVTRDADDGDDTTHPDLDEYHGDWSADAWAEAGSVFHRWARVTTSTTLSDDRLRGLEGIIVEIDSSTPVGGAALKVKWDHIDGGFWHRASDLVAYSYNDLGDAQPTAAPNPLPSVPAAFRRDEDGDLQGTVPADRRTPSQFANEVLGAGFEPWQQAWFDEAITYRNGRTTADPWTGHELPNDTTEPPRRSPNPATPYDEPRSIFQRLIWPDLRRMWLRGYWAAKDAE